MKASDRVSTYLHMSNIANDAAIGCGFDSAKGSRYGERRKDCKERC